MDVLIIGVVVLICVVYLLVQTFCKSAAWHLDDDEYEETPFYRMKR